MQVPKPPPGFFQEAGHPVCTVVVFQPLRAVEGQCRMPGEYVEVGVGMEHGYALSNRVRGNQTVHQPADGFTAVPADPVETRRLLVVDWQRRKQGGTAAGQAGPRALG
jgi:hypothetical protein